MTKVTFYRDESHFFLMTFVTKTVTFGTWYFIYWWYIILL